MTIIIEARRLVRYAALTGALLLSAAPAALAEQTGYEASQAAQACAADLHLDPSSTAYSDCVRATLWSQQDLAAR